MSKEIVYVDGINCGTISQYAKECGQSEGYVYNRLSGRTKDGHRYSTEPDPPRRATPVVKVHHPGEPLIPHPITCGISTEWRG